MLTSCNVYTIADYKMDMLLRYYNATTSDLIVNFGIPTNTYKYGDMTLVEYYREETKYVPKSYTVRKDTYNSSDRVYSDTEVRISESGGYTQKYTCKKTFYLRNERIFDVRIEGNDCL